MDVTKPASLPVDPLRQFITDSPIIASPPIVPSSPAKKLPTAVPNICWSPSYGVFCRSATTSVVMRFSIVATINRVTPCVMTVVRPSADPNNSFAFVVAVAMSYRESIQKGKGKALSLVSGATSSTVSVSLPNASLTMRNSKATEEATATSEEGMSFPTTGTLVKNSMVIMASRHRIAINTAVLPVTHVCPGPIWKGCSCANPITMARPLTNPIMTGVGTSCISDASRSRANRNMRTEATSTDRKRASAPIYSQWASCPWPSHFFSMYVDTTAATAPVTPLIRPVLLPRAVAKRPTIHVAWRPTEGSRLAMREKAIVSGTCAKHTMRPLSISVFQYCHPFPTPQPWTIPFAQ
mmetsp:Transcript_10978/g.31823  ORF Transcript_10978/g.31823 Transcript_10978/m.31823 type:complete len:352 (+) Transcript_10978:1439-2494(+)